MRIAVVVLDTLRKDAFDKYFDWIPGQNYQRAYATSNWTIPSHASLFTGRYPSEVGTHAKSPTLSTSYPILPEILKKEGFQTSLITANPLLYYVDGWTQGFDRKFGPWDLTRGGKENTLDWVQFSEENSDLGPLRLKIEAIRKCLKSDGNTVKSILSGFQYYAKNRTPISGGESDGESILDIITDFDFKESEFLFINLMDAHAPYNPPQKFNSLGQSVSVPVEQQICAEIENNKSVKTAYYDAAEYLSHIYEKIFVKLNREFDYIFTISDHGELLGEYGRWNHGHGLYPELTNIPMVISSDHIQNKTVDSPASILDIFQTIIDLVNLDIDSQGTSLLRGEASEPFLTEFHGIREARKKKYINRGLSEEVIEKVDSEFYGIVTEEDYHYQVESGDIKSQEIDNRDQIIEDIHNLREELDIEEENGNGEIPDGLKSHLEHLGYA